MNITEDLVIGSHNEIVLTLTEDAAAIQVSPTEISIDIGGLVTITRTPTGDGIVYAAGVITITPALLTEDLSALRKGKLYPVKIKLKAASDPSGVVYGAGDSTGRLHFLMDDDAAA